MMTELRARVVNRLITAQHTGDPAPLRTEEAMSDTLALLREATPSPADATDLDALADVLWSWWLAYRDGEGPQAWQYSVMGLSVFGFLRLRLPDDARLPQPLLETFDPTDQLHEVRFASLVRSAHAEEALGSPDAGGPRQLAALDRAIAWSDAAHRFPGIDPPVSAELAFAALGLCMSRFQIAADPDSLAAAARHAGVLCERLGALPPAAATGTTEAAEAALTTVIDAARLLGEPALPEVERLVAAAPAAALTAEAGEGLAALREVDALPVSWPGERDLRVGALIADSGAREHDAGRIACGIRRLRRALAQMPADHPDRPHATAALSQALHAFSRERDDHEAAREAVDLAAAVTGFTDAAHSELSEEDAGLFADWRELSRRADSGDGESDQDQVLLFRRLVSRLREKGEREGEAPDITIETLDILLHTSSHDSSAVATDERITRYGAALDALPADQPGRYAHVALLAALTGARAETLTDSQPGRATELAARARTLTDEAAAGAPAGFLPLNLLRRELFGPAVEVTAAVLSLGGEEDTGKEGWRPPEELADVSRMLSLLTRVEDIRPEDPERLDSAIADLRELLADPEVDAEIRPYLGAMLGSALFARVPEDGDHATVFTQQEEVVQLLRSARSQTPEALPGIDRILGYALTTTALGNFDAEANREASALLASAAAEEPADDGDAALLSVRLEFHNALQNYLFGHEPAQLERSRELARRLKELADAASATRAGNDPQGLDRLGDFYINLVETIGPGGSLNPELDDQQVDRCRQTFAATPAGHPMRSLTAITLMRVLTMRAAGLRGDPVHAARLLSEADEVLRAVEPEVPQSFSQMMRFLITLVPKAGGTGHPGHAPPHAPPPTPAPKPGTTPPDHPGAPVDSLRAMEAMMQPLLRQASAPDQADDPAVWQDPAMPVWFRAHGALGSAAKALRGPAGVEGGLVHLETAVDAMANITDRGSDQGSAEHGLTTFDGDIRTIVELILGRIALDAGAALLPDLVTATRELLTAIKEKRRPPEALVADTEHLNRSIRSAHSITGPHVDRVAELLERGRGLLLARRIEARADLGELRSAHPALAAEFERLTDLLAGRPADPDPAPAAHAEQARLAALRASRDLDTLIGHVRAQPGFAAFLRPLTVEQLRALTCEGPVVVLNHAKGPCHALITTPDSIIALPLKVKADEVSGAARRLRDAVDILNARGSSRAAPAQLVAAGATIRETLAWTWHMIVSPVLGRLGLRDPVPDGATWPRVWWVPTGAFHALPLHAAQCVRTDCALDHDCGAALDSVVSSYVPGFRTLAHARAQAGRPTTGTGDALLVAAPDEDLPGVAEAAAYASGLLGGPEPLIGADATREAVLVGLGATSWAHFGCHAATDPAEPSGAVLHLPSGEQMSVLEICRAQPRSARLAFLAACSTARTSERLADEAIHVTSAFLLAGFPTAVGTLWEIDSVHASRITRHFYRRVLGEGVDAAAHALHHTIRELRLRLPDRPHIWAAYVHAGT
ncbi:CHAT domain-containing protein [Streptomyces xiamenensis]